MYCEGCDKMESEISALKAENEKLKKRLQMVSPDEVEFRNLREKVAFYQEFPPYERIDKLESDLAAAKKEIQDLMDQLKAANRQCDFAIKERDEARYKISEVKGDLYSQKLVTVDLAEKLSAREDEVERMRELLEMWHKDYCNRPHYLGDCPTFDLLYPPTTKAFLDESAGGYIIDGDPIIVDEKLPDGQHETKSDAIRGKTFYDITQGDIVYRHGHPGRFILVEELPEKKP